LRERKKSRVLLLRRASVVHAEHMTNRRRPRTTTERFLKADGQVIMTAQQFAIELTHVEFVEVEELKIMVP